MIDQQGVLGCGNRAWWWRSHFGGSSSSERWRFAVAGL